VNGSVAKIEIFKPFGEAFELMKTILFQPFDLKKWFVIGFAAWLSNLGFGGGGGGGSKYRYNTSDWQDIPWIQNLNDTLHQIPIWIIFAVGIALLILIFGLAILFAWLRARGAFMFVDCIVRNRGAIAEPWRELRKQGNSYFLFALLVGLIILIVLALTALPFMLPILRGVTFAHLHDVYLICMIALWAMVLVVLIFAWVVISHLMIAIMYRRRCLAVEAFRTAVSLIAKYPGEVTLYCLFWILLAIGSAMISCVAILATCCIALIPYIGTVILLPLFVCLRAFGLRFIRQFGPDYDVWAAVPQPPLATEPPPLPS
jgi:hypothetical protein